MRRSHEDSLRELQQMVQDAGDDEGCTQEDDEANEQKDMKIDLGQVTSQVGNLERRTLTALDDHAARVTAEIEKLQQKGEDELRSIDEVATLKAKLAVAEERANVFQATISEMRNDYAQDRKILQEQYESQLEQYTKRTVTAQNELQQLAVEFGSSKAQMKRLESAYEEQRKQAFAAEQQLYQMRSELHSSHLSSRNEDVDALSREVQRLTLCRENDTKTWLMQEETLRTQMERMRHEQEAKAVADVAKATEGHVDVVDRLKARIVDLENEMTSHAEALARWEKGRTRLETKLEATTIKHANQLVDASQREKELRDMLHELQGIINVTGLHKAELLRTHATELQSAEKCQKELICMLRKVRGTFGAQDDNHVEDDEASTQGSSTEAGSSFIRAYH
jgi:hypothetical protein